MIFSSVFPVLFWLTYLPFLLGVFLFSSVYPLAAFLALANNLIEIKMDAYKLCRFTRKPTPRGVRDIGTYKLDNQRKMYYADLYFIL